MPSNAPKETGNAFAAEQDAAKEWAKALESAGKASDELVAKNLDLSKSQAALKTYMESAAAAINEKTNPAMNDMVKAAYEANIALEALGKLADVIEAQQKRTSTAEDETQKERERVAAIGLTIEAVANLNATRLEEMATAKERTLLAAQGIDLSGELSDAIKGEVKALRERAALIRTGAEKENAVEAAKAASEEWKRGWEQTDQLAREAFTAWAEDGSSAAKKIGDTLKKALLAAIYEATLKPLVFDLYTSVVGAPPPGAKGVSNLTTAANGASTLSNMYSAGKSVYTVGGQYVAGTMSGANAAATVYANATGGGIDALLATNGAYGTTASAAASAATAEAAAAEAMYAAEAVAAGTGTGAAAAGGAAAGAEGTFLGMGPYGWAAAAVIAVLSMSHGSYVNSIGESGQNFGSDGKLTSMDPKRFNVDNKIADQIVAGMNDDYMTIAAKLGVKTSDHSFYYGGNDSDGGKALVGASVSGKSVYNTGEVKADDAAIKLMASRAVLSALEASDLPKYLADFFDSVDIGSMDQKSIDNVVNTATQLKSTYDLLATIPGADLTAFTGDMVANIVATAPALAAVSAEFSDLTGTLFSVSEAGGAAAAGLVAAMGGLQQFQSTMNSLYDAYTTSDQKRADTVNTVVSDLAAAGITVSAEQVSGATREQVAAVVAQYKSQVGTETGNTQFAAVAGRSGPGQGRPIVQTMAKDLAPTLHMAEAGAEAVVVVRPPCKTPP